MAGTCLAPQHNERSLAMAKLIILRGLPASGKSTWARSWCEDPAVFSQVGVSCFVT
ncbi:ATP-binding protein, partial [Bifidobacterium longum]|uniref:ATP-binding protein n=1 Tax=Bifidobacterium longum TaxID=216816 RepID=UPI001F60AC99